MNELLFVRHGMWDVAGIVFNLIIVVVLLITLFFICWGFWRYGLRHPWNHAVRFRKQSSIRFLEWRAKQKQTKRLKGGFFSHIFKKNLPSEKSLSKQYRGPQIIDATDDQ